MVDLVCYASLLISLVALSVTIYAWLKGKLFVVVQTGPPGPPGPSGLSQN